MEISCFSNELYKLQLIGFRFYASARGRSKPLPHPTPDALRIIESELPDFLRGFRSKVRSPRPLA